MVCDQHELNQRRRARQLRAGQVEVFGVDAAVAALQFPSSLAAHVRALARAARLQRAACSALAGRLQRARRSLGGVRLSPRIG